MLDHESQNELNSLTKVTQIVVGALCMSTIVAGCVIHFAFSPRAGPLGEISYLGFAVALVSVIASIAVPRIVGPILVQQSKQAKLPNQLKTEAGKLTAIFQAITLIRCSILEGAAFLLLFGYLQEGHWATITLAGLMLFAIATQVPTYTRLETWVLDQQRRLAEDQMLQPSDSPYQSHSSKTHWA